MKSERFNLRMTPQEKTAIIKRANQAARTTSEFIIDTALNRLQCPDLGPFTEKLAGIHSELARLTEVL